MNRAVFILLFVAAIDRVILQGIYPVLPVLIADLGANARDNSIFMAVTYASIAAGSWLTPRILDRFGAVGKLSIILSLLTAISLLGMGMSRSYTFLLITTSFYWFFCGVQLNIYSIIMSYVSPPEKSGQNFGLLANTAIFGAVLGGFFMGSVIHYLGNFYSFLLFGMLTIAGRLVMLFPGFDIVYARHNVVKSNFRITAKVWLLLIVLNAGIMLSFTGRFNLSLIMKEQHFTINAISSLFALGALLVFPFPYLFGLLSHKISGKLLLFISLLSVTVAMFLLYKYDGYTSLLTTGFLIGIMTYCSRGVTQKIIYDLYPLSEQKNAQSVLSSATWVAAIMGFLLVTVTSGHFSLQGVSLFSFGVGVLSLVLLVIIPFR